MRAMPGFKPSCSGRFRCRCGEVSERLQKLLAAAGHGSRRQIEQWIRAGRVSVDGHLATLGERCAAGADIRLDGRRLELVAETSSPREGLLYDKPASVLLFTTDGAPAHRLMHPSSEVEREYLVRVRGQPPASVLARLRAGLMLEDGPAHFDAVEPVPAQGSEAAAADAAHASFRVVLHEGRNREVRRLWQAVGFEVSRLSRLRYGAVQLPSDLRPGQWRLLSEREAAEL